MKTVACIIARTNSTRLPKKILKKINNKSMIEYIIDSIKHCNNVDEIYICTSIHQDDSILKGISINNNIKFYAGSENSVIDRMLDVAEIEKADNVIRITGDNIFTDSVYLDIMIKKHINGNYEYTRTEYLPIGITAEVIKVDALKMCYKMMNPNESQYLLIYMFQPKKFHSLVLIPPEKHRHPDWSFTVDNQADWERTSEVLLLIEGRFSYNEILEIAEKNKLPNLIYNAGEIVKLPANIVLYFATFRKEMELRIEHSDKIMISLDEYIEVKNEQKF